MTKLDRVDRLVRERPGIILPEAADILSEDAGTLAAVFTELVRQGRIEARGTRRYALARGGKACRCYFTTHRERASASDMRALSRERMSIAASERRFKPAPRLPSKSGSGVIAPAPYYRGALWPIVPKRKAAA